MSDSVTPPLPRPTSLRETPLCQWHAAHGGRMVDFAGWNMPVQYASIVDEHLATRSSVGLFDVSHMGRLSVTGPGALDWLESMLTRKVAGIVPGQFRYTLVTADAPEPPPPLPPGAALRLEMTGARAALHAHRREAHDDAIGSK